MEIMRRTSLTNYLAECRRRECNNLRKAVPGPLVAYQVICVRKSTKKSACRLGTGNALEELSR